MAFVPCHVWVTVNGRNFKVVFEASGRPSHIMEWKSRGVYTRYWYSAPRRRKPREGGLAARVIAEAEEIRCA